MNKTSSSLHYRSLHNQQHQQRFDGVTNDRKEFSDEV